LFHIAMGAVLGIAAFGRTQEKLNGANNGGAQTPATGFPSGPATFSQPQSGFGAAPGGFGSTSPSGFTSSPGFGAPAAPATSFAPAPSWGTTQIATTAGGKKLVPDEPQPLI